VVDATGEVFGEAPNIAARVQGLAEPGTVLVTANVQRQTAGLFVAEDKGARELKGVPAPVTLYRIARASGGRRAGDHPMLMAERLGRAQRCGSAFTRVAARTLAPPPKCDLLHRRLQPFRHLHDCSGCFRLERFAGWDLHPLESAAFHGAHPLQTSHIASRRSADRQIAVIGQRFEKWSQADRVFNRCRHTGRIARLHDGVAASSARAVSARCAIGLHENLIQMPARKGRGHN
jgi:hypothetical protein